MKSMKHLADAAGCFQEVVSLRWGHYAKTPSELDARLEFTLRTERDPDVVGVSSRCRPALTFSNVGGDRHSGAS